MWHKLVLVALLLSGSLQAIAAKGNEHVIFEKFDYVNQTMTDLGFPEDNYSPSNFYTVSLTKNQRVNVSEKVEAVEHGKTAGLLSYHCMTKDFKNCKVDVEAYDVRGKKIFSEKNSEAGTYKIKFATPGEYKISFYNREVAGGDQKSEKQVSIGLECYWCGKLIEDTKLQFLNKDQLKEKLDRLDQIKRIIGAMMMLTTNTKRVVATFASSRLA